LKLKSRINIIFALQFSQILRFVTFLIISAFFTKRNLSHLSRAEIGDFELMMLLSSALSYFWVTGIIQSFLPLYNNNSIFPKRANERLKSPEIYNTFLLLAFFSIGFALFIYIFRNNIYVYKDLRTVPYINHLIIYFILSNITPLIEYIYYVRNRPYQIVYYVFITSIATLFLVCGPVFLNMGIEMAINGLIAINCIRLIWIVVLLKRYAKFRFSFKYIKAHLSLGFPLVGSGLLSGSSQYVDGFIASWITDPASFALFRYGAKELPFSSSLTNGLNNAMLTEFDTPERSRRAMYDIKKKSLKLMHYLFPISLVIMFFSKWIYNNLFSYEFHRSADVFVVYLLMVISRIVFPQTILIGMKKTRIVFWASLVEIILNIILSIYLSRYYMNGSLGLVGIALGTAVVHLLEKIFLMIYNYYKLGISPHQYIPMRWYLFYTSLITIIFVLIDRRVIHIFN
jgi:O-antigen/teichoic acid export membrane protein